jgi:hypothetical protein
MNTQPKTIAELLSHELIQELPRPADRRYGQAIFERDGVKIIESRPDYVEAWVGGLDGSVIEGGSQRRRTRFFATTDGLAWQCAGNPKNHQIFCKHCVALALALLQKSI